MTINSCQLNGIKTYAFESKNDFINYVNNKNVILIAINAEKILHAPSLLKEIIKENIGYPDGIGAVWALKKHGFKHVKKIPGCELWLDIIHKYYQTKSFYLIGSKPEVIQNTVEKLKQQYNGIKILNYRDGYIKNQKEKDELIINIKHNKPDIVFVAAGSPFQELLMKELKENHPALYMGLGGSFDVYTGKTKRAPEFWLKMHLEWLYRLISQPTRIKRQIHLIRFAYLNAIGRI